jgi:hypothetical protein
VLSVNLDGAFLSLRTALRLLRDGGSAVLTASVAGLAAEPNTGAYAVSKAAVIQLAKVAAREAAARSVRVNAIAPGAVDTPIWDGLAFFEDLVSQGGTRASALEAMAQMATPLKRYASAEEIAGPDRLPAVGHGAERHRDGAGRATGASRSSLVDNLRHISALRSFRAATMWLGFPACRGLPCKFALPPLPCFCASPLPPLPRKKLHPPPPPARPPRSGKSPGRSAAWKPAPAA